MAKVKIWRTEHIRPGKLKIHRVAVAKQVQAMGEPVIVTKRRAPVVKIEPVQADRSDIFGFMAGKVEIIGNVE
jgi:antitoxin (DNA-binding transcriptional repressor) of toxin-antitoxin stability system